MPTLNSDWFGTDSAALSRAIVAHAGVALVAADADLRVRLWNPAAARLFGAEAEAILGTPLMSLIPSEDRAAASMAFDRAVRDGESTELEFRYPDARGRFRELAAGVTPLTGDDGAARGVLMAVRDVTRRFEAERQAGEARKMTALGDMAGAIAHHFNNILGGIATTVDFALMNGDEVELREALEKTAASASRAAQLVHGLLAFAEGERRDEALARVSDLLARLGAEFVAACRRQHIELNIDTSGDNAMAPEVPVLTALRQLMQNAVDAMPSGGRLRLRDGSDENVIRIEVEDSGPGLSAEHLRRVFEPFFRVADPTDRDSMQRAGLGLSIAYGMIRNIGGVLHVQSEPGRGARFTIELPREA